MQQFIVNLTLEVLLFSKNRMYWVISQKNTEERVYKHHNRSQYQQFLHWNTLSSL
jgi:hypothetical protein